MFNEADFFVVFGFRTLIRGNSRDSALWLFQSFDCFCKVNRYLLDGCLIRPDDGSAYFCKDGQVNAVSSTWIVPSCFAGGTRVLTPSGEKNIETIKVGDEVLAYDSKLNKNIPSKVLRTFRHKNRNYFAEKVLVHNLK